MYLCVFLPNLINWYKTIDMKLLLHVCLHFKIFVRFIWKLGFTLKYHTPKQQLERIMIQSVPKKIDPRKTIPNCQTMYPKYVKYTHYHLLLKAFSDRHNDGIILWSCFAFFGLMNLIVSWIINVALLWPHFYKVKINSCSSYSKNLKYAHKNVLR